MRAAARPERSVARLQTQQQAIFSATDSTSPTSFSMKGATDDFPPTYPAQNVDLLLYAPRGEKRFAPASPGSTTERSASSPV
jgi:hypothetical protein